MGQMEIKIEYDFFFSGSISVYFIICCWNEKLNLYINIQVQLVS